MQSVKQKIKLKTRHRCPQPRLAAPKARRSRLRAERLTCRTIFTKSGRSRNSCARSSLKMKPFLEASSWRNRKPHKSFKIRYAMEDSASLRIEFSL